MKRSPLVSTNHKYLYQIGHTQRQLFSVYSLLHVSALIASIIRPIISADTRKIIYRIKMEIFTLKIHYINI
jgi:hypothetical protein